MHIVLNRQGLRMSNFVSFQATEKLNTKKQTSAFIPYIILNVLAGVKTYERVTLVKF